MTTRSRGFSLIELLVVVAILGIVSAIGIIGYSGYVSSSKKKAVENGLMQLSLGQTEYYSDNSAYYGSAAGTTCTPSSTTTTTVQTKLVGGAEIFSSDLGYSVCAVTNAAAFYFLVAKENGGNCEIKLTGNTQSITRTNC